MRLLLGCSKTKKPPLETMIIQMITVRATIQFASVTHCDRGSAPSGSSWDRRVEARQIQIQVEQTVAKELKERDLSRRASCIAVTIPSFVKMLFQMLCSIKSNLAEERPREAHAR